MTEWVSKQTQFIGVYECKISILSLAKLLEHAVSTDDKRFQNIFVRGDRIINPVEGIRTRSKVKNGAATFIYLFSFYFFIFFFTKRTRIVHSSAFVS